MRRRGSAAWLTAPRERANPNQLIMEDYMNDKEAKGVVIIASLTVLFVLAVAAATTIEFL